MPHSSGGGSHGGGFHRSRSRSHSHGGSHSGGASGSVSRPVTVSAPRRGYTRYAFYRQGRINYQYVKDKPDGILHNFLYMFILLPFLISGIIVFLSGIRYVKPLDTASYPSDINIEDNTGIMTDGEEKELFDAFERFQDKTGITCSIITAYNSDWQPYYSNMSNFAYDLYVNHWMDEKHWLFVYSEPEDADIAMFNDWYWEGMQGDDTDAILTRDVTDCFNEKVQRYLTMNSYTVSDAFGLALDELTDNIKCDGISVDPEIMVFVVVWFWMILMISCFNFIPMMAHRKRDKAEIEKLHSTGIPVSEHPLEDTCAYCGGVYIHGVHLECPHCGAAIVPMGSVKS